ncbi:uromodulin-like 1, partial [Sceloporus undulatus]|uniref:uromodulin-like 1 n=1 Tax=Sceloporus undulatus TaxID=8520 RepID=UPI001C4C0E47
SVALSRSSEFASRPGACPAKEMEVLNISCTFDLDCPEHKKCCETSKGTGCSNPVPEVEKVTKHWYNVSVLVKMDFNELSRVDPRLLNHSRLLHSMINGALWPLNASVYHIRTTKAEPYTETVVSQVLVGLQESIPSVNVSSLLNDIVMRVSEVIDIVVQDWDPGSSDVLLQNRNSVLVQNFTSASQETGKPLESECYTLPIRNHRIFGVTNSSFEMSWSINSMQNHSFQVDIFKGKELIQRMEIMDMKLEVSNLEAGVMYTVNVSYEVCSKHIYSHKNVKTDGLIFGLTLRILNYNFTNQLLNSSNIEYQAFSGSLMTEIRNSFPSNMSALYKMGMLKMHLDSFKAGSIIVILKIIIGDMQFPKDLSVFDSMISSLYKSRVFLLDPNSSVVEDWNECASRAENDCCMFASCINTIGSYICRCKTTTDANPLRPGRNCEGEIVDPTTEMVPTLEANVTEGLSVISATALSMTESTVIPFTPKSTEAMTVPPSGTQMSNTLSIAKNVPASQSTSTLGYVKDNKILSTSATTSLATTMWGNVTTSNRNLAEEGLSKQKQQNSSLSTLPGVSNTTVYPFVTSGTVGEASTPSLLTDRNSQKDPSLNVTEHPALNQSLDKEVGKDNRSWSEEKISKMSLSSSEEHTHSAFATDCGVPPQAGRIIFSNITSTSFHVGCPTNFSQNSAFQFFLFEGKQLLQEIKTQSSNLTFSRLKPGILYTVEMQVEVCGKKGKLVQHKVMTAVQKFNGTVRISNMNYRSEFSDSSSEEFQNFTQLFLTEIRTSLPLSIIQKMDAGMIQMLIMNITNGSIVVSFSLLIPADMDANNVTRSFLEAFQNNCYLMIDNSSVSIHDYDECVREETDCSADASCYNTYGSYECNCKEGFINVNTERPGRICEAKGLENTVTSSSVNKALTEPTVNDRNSLQASSLPFTKFSIKNEVQVLCEFEKIVISIQKAFLQNRSIPESSFYLGRPHCNVSKSNSSHVILQTGWNECGTEVQSNTTHTIVKTILRNDMSSLGVIHHLRVASPIHCVFPNDLLTSSGYTQEGVYTMFEDLHGSGRFLTEMQLFIGNSPVPKNFSISASEDIMIEVGIQTEDSKLKVVVGECWATPTNNSMDLLSFPFIHGSCPVPNTHTTVISNGMSRKAQFKLKIFSFVNDSVVYLHCKIHVCMETPGTTCKASCSGFRSQRSGETIAMPRTSWGPLRKSSDDLKDKKVPGLGAGYIILIVLGIFVLALGTVGFFVCRHQRKAGTYNFKIKSDNFNYQVFCD